MKALMFLLLLLWGVGALYGLGKGQPAVISQTGPWREARELRFLYDLSYDSGGSRLHEERILPAMLAEIEAARCFIVVDIFLFNQLGQLGAEQGASLLAPEDAGDHGFDGTSDHRVPDGYLRDHPSPVALFSQALIAAKQRRPELVILFISDEINTGYGSYHEPHLERLAAHGIEVIFTDLDRLRDSNPLYSGLWRPLLQWWQPVVGRGRLPNPLAAEAPAFTLPSWLRLLNFKANHRKVLLTENSAMVSSGNIHDASLGHSNIAFLLSGEIIADLLAGELAVARFSGLSAPDPFLAAATLPVAPATVPVVASAATPPVTPSSPRSPGGAARELALEKDGDIMVRVLSEEAILRQLLAAIDQAGAGERIWLGHFYLAERRVMAALVAAARRGVDLRLILDPNRDAFGREKRGIPNRQSAARLRAAVGDNLQVRWYDTRGEQFHVKLTMIEQAEQVVIIGGSANLTRRNLAGYNLETCLEIRAGRQSAVAAATAAFFERLWANRDGQYTLDYGVFAESSPLKSAWAAWQEFSGMGTF